MYQAFTGRLALTKHHLWFGCLVFCFGVKRRQTMKPLLGPESGGTSCLLVPRLLGFPSHFSSKQVIFTATREVSKEMYEGGLGKSQMLKIRVEHLSSQATKTQSLLNLTVVISLGWFIYLATSVVWERCDVIFFTSFCKWNLSSTLQAF